MITRTELKNFRDDFDKAIKELAEKYNVNISLGTISYSDFNFHAKMTVTKIADNDNNPVNLKEKDFYLYCQLYGLEKEDYGRKIRLSDNKEYQIIGINPRASKNPICLMSGGKTYKGSARMVLQALGRKVDSLELVDILGRNK